MSLSADNSAFRAPPSGKTPPPAPSAAYAKRARELQAEAGLSGRYRRLRCALSNLADRLLTRYPHRHDASDAQPYLRPITPQVSGGQGLEPYPPTSNLPPSATPPHPRQMVAPPSLAPSRPGLRHSTSVASSVASTAAREPNSRLRSGSLTLPTGGLSNAFGPSIFSSSWLSSGANGGYSALDELRSVTSADSTDEFDVHTLDYLGLDDRPRPPPAATISELRNQAQAALLAGNHAGYGSSNYLTKSYKPAEHLAPTRPRAISVGVLDDPMRSLQRRANAVEAHNYMNELSHQSSGLSITTNNNPGSILKANAKLAPQAVASPTVSQATRSSSPKAETPASQVQTPSRSLWIGNLDGVVTSEQLIHVFAPYGAIESLRLLPEKECGFVNFVDQADAIRAKDDVLNRLGGNIGMPNGQTVRIGFGKADSAPVAPAKGNPTSPAPASPGASKPANSNAALGGMELQSTPTRALWIGSIPSTTTPATILSVFSPYGPIESARVLTHKNCGFINFERLDDAVRARKALNGRDVLGSDVGAIRIGFAKVPVKNGADTSNAGEENSTLAVQAVGDLSVGATIHALRTVKGAITIPADQQVLGGAVENYRSNLLLSMIAAGAHNAYATDARGPSVTEQQMIMKQLTAGSLDAEQDVMALADFRPPTMYYTTIPLVSERPHSRRWDASKLRELRKRLDSGTMTVEEIDQVATDFLEGEIVDLASDWLGNTVVQKLFERCSPAPRFSMLERISPNLAMIGIHKNGTWLPRRSSSVFKAPRRFRSSRRTCGRTLRRFCLISSATMSCSACLFDMLLAIRSARERLHLRCHCRPHVGSCARSLRCSEHASLLGEPAHHPQPAAKGCDGNHPQLDPARNHPNGALLLTWLLDTSGFPSRYNLLAPRFTPHLSHLCTHKLASLTVLRIVNQKIEPDASTEIVEALFSSAGDHVLADVLGDQVNGVSVVHKILTSPFIDPILKNNYIEATKRVLIELKVIATQAYRRLIEEVGLPVPNFQPTYSAAVPGNGKNKSAANNGYGVPGLPSGYPSNDQGLASMMAALQMGGQNSQAGPAQLQIDPSYASPNAPRRTNSTGPGYSPDLFSPFGGRGEGDGMRGGRRNTPNGAMPSPVPYGAPSPPPMMAQPTYGAMPGHVYHQGYMYAPYQQPPQTY
ncbi:unnamed protein product [Mycena citricolor]|uniref:Uncharacterized protein n=1 Tax=Mycena citricolor TaxID=2018698 RepID=A0AAD2HT31_9AGAR|nr:unnamed protein product [Mycena citricolor]